MSMTKANDRPIDKAVAYFRTKVALADALNVHRSYIGKMVKTGHVPVAQCRAIEMVTNGTVTAEQLRPDIFLPPDKAA